MGNSADNFGQPESANKDMENAISINQHRHTLSEIDSIVFLSADSGCLGLRGFDKRLIVETTQTETVCAKLATVSTLFA